jgi:isoamyl acetate esterase
LDIRTFYEKYSGGRTLDDGLVAPEPPQYHTKVAEQLAHAYIELQNLTFNYIGRLWYGEPADQSIEIIATVWHYSLGPVETSLEYFYNQRHGRRSTNSHYVSE